MEARVLSLCDERREDVTHKLSSNIALFLIVCGSLSFGESLTYIAYPDKATEEKLINNKQAI